MFCKARARNTASRQFDGARVRVRVCDLQLDLSGKSAINDLCRPLRHLVRARARARVWSNCCGNGKRRVFVRVPAHLHIHRLRVVATSNGEPVSLNKTKESYTQVAHNGHARARAVVGVCAVRIANLNKHASSSRRATCDFCTHTHTHTRVFWAQSDGGRKRGYCLLLRSSYMYACARVVHTQKHIAKNDVRARTNLSAPRAHNCFMTTHRGGRSGSGSSS